MPPFPPQVLPPLPAPAVLQVVSIIYFFNVKILMLINK